MAIPQYGNFNFMHEIDKHEFSNLFAVINEYNASTIFNHTDNVRESIFLDLIQNDSRMSHHSPSSLSLYLQDIKCLYIDGWKNFYHNYQKKQTISIYTEIEKLCYPNTLNRYNYKDTEYIIGEIEFDTIKKDTSEKLSKFKNQVIIFNNYFSINDINQTVNVFYEDVCIEIKPLNMFFHTNINHSHSAEFIILPCDYVLSNDTINLVIEYITSYLYKNYEKEDVEDYIKLVKNTFNGNLKNVTFDKPIIFNLTYNIIENFSEDAESEPEIED